MLYPIVNAYKWIIIDYKRFRTDYHLSYTPPLLLSIRNTQNDKEKILKLKFYNHAKS